MEIFPNPANYKIHVKSQSEIELLQIFDMHGKMVDTYQMNKNEQSFEVSNYNPGVYIVVAKTANQILSQRFIKN